MANSKSLIVGLGASAGGIKACKEFFEHVPKDSGIGYVVILHLSPEHDSKLAEVLQVSAAIPVTQVRERVRVEPNHVYVIPPNQTLSIRDEHLVLSEMTQIEQRRSPVDTFFRALAEAHGPHAGCVVLSGTGANGSLGLKHVKELGGICLAQDPQEAEYNDMPRHAIATGLVDAVLPVAEMPARLVGYSRTFGVVVETVSGPEASTEVDERALREIFGVVRARTGHDFSSYKRPTVMRRVGRRMALHQVEDLGSYARVLREQPDEPPALLKDLLISVTNFFRDRHPFDTLERLIVPKLFERKGSADQVRVWVPGCATGEEAYSIAMLLAEHVSGAPGGPSVQLFATDIDERAIAIARDGLYTESDVAELSPERLAQFFIKDGEGYRVRKELRELILFAPHNLLKDPPFAHLDLVSCRNLLIYLDRPAQQRTLEILHFALRPGGYLLLGSSEAIEGAGDLFATVDRDAHLFQSRAVSSRVTLPVPELAPLRRPDVGSPAPPGAQERAQPRVSFADLHHRLLEEYAPASLVVNEEHEIVHLTEHAGRYLQFAAGEPSHNLLKAIRPELRLEVRTALYQAAQQHTPVTSGPLTLRVGNRTVTVRVLVKPVLREDDTARGFFLVLFEEAAEADGTAAPGSAATATLAPGDTARQLEAELIRVKGQLRATIEQHETQAEELKASNEELQAMNEELRSSAEELETSKEELQSLNEELSTVNQELKHKIEELSQANNDVQNLINSTEIGTVFLDRSFRIKLYTPRARNVFTLIPSDRGRPLFDITDNLVDVDLRADVHRVLERLERIEREVVTRDGQWLLMQAVPYRTAEDRIDGVILTFLDITERRRAEERLRQSETRLRLMIESAADYAIFTIDVECRIDTWNSGAARMFGYAEDEAIGRSAAILFTPEDREQRVAETEMRLARDEGRASDERWHIRKDGSRFYVSGIMAPLRDASGRLVGYVKIARDLTERKQWEDKLQQAHDALERRVAERTRELEASNRSLDAELQERRAAEERIRGLLTRLISVQEDERRRIALDLHDHLGQQMTALRLKLESAIAAAASIPAVHEQLTAIDDLTRRLDGDLDFLTWELRPAGLDDLGLVATLGTFVHEWSKNYGIAAEFDSSGLDHERLGFEVETNLYRIAQEALNNIFKHASATQVGVLLERRDDHVVLVVEDDGKGFDEEAEHTRSKSSDKGLGLAGMRERAAFIGGRCEIETAPGKGTSIIVQLPISPQVIQQG
jgi:two-component system CheB/CheR fusion protein